MDQERKKELVSHISLWAKASIGMVDMFIDEMAETPDLVEQMDEIVQDMRRNAEDADIISVVTGARAEEIKLMKAEADVLQAFVAIIKARINQRNATEDLQKREVIMQDFNNFRRRIGGL